MESTGVPGRSRDLTSVPVDVGMLIALACVLVMTGAVFLDPHLVHPDRPTARVAADTFAAGSALLIGYLVAGRFRQGGLVRHAILATTMFTLALSNFVFSVLPAVLRGTHTTSPAPILAAVGASALFASTGFVPEWRVREEWRRPAAYGMFAVAAFFVVVASSVAALVDGHVTVQGLTSVDTFGATGNLTTGALQGCSAALLAVGSVGCLLRWREDGDPLVGVFAIAGVFATASRLEFALASSPSSGLATSAAMLRLAFYAVLLGGAGTEIRDYWHHATDVAVLEERRRIARDLHDGLAQELAYVATQSRVQAQWSPDSQRAQRIAAAAERALDESRRAIAALTRPLDEALDVALAQTAEEVAGRHNMRVHLELTPGIEVSNDTREALLRITREAITNAGRHGEARRVTVLLANGAIVDELIGANGDGAGTPARVVLIVADNGKGFDPNDAKIRAGSFGLTSMKERVEGLGGELRVTSRPYGGGTEVEVLIP